jgi:hypothetical protein
METITVVVVVSYFAVSLWIGNCINRCASEQDREE